MQEKSAHCIKMQRGNKITPHPVKKNSRARILFSIMIMVTELVYIVTPSIITVTQKEALKATEIIIIIIIIPHGDTNLFFLLHLSQINLFQVPSQIWNPTSYRRLKKDGKFSPIRRMKRRLRTNGCAT